MVQINFASREVNCKIVYYGPGRCGKTTNLQLVHEKAPANSTGELVSIATETDRTLYFDFLPLDLGTVAGMRTKFQLYTVPGQVYYDATRKLVLQGCDGIVFVADSNPDLMAENIESLDNLAKNLKENGLDLMDVPLVLQFNKRDIANAMPVEEMNSKLNRNNWPAVEAVAVNGDGVFQTLKAISQGVIKRLNREQGFTDEGNKRGRPSAMGGRNAQGQAVAHAPANASTSAANKAVATAAPGAMAARTGTSAPKAPASPGTLSPRVPPPPKPAAVPAPPGRSPGATRTPVVAPPRTSETPPRGGAATNAAPPTQFSAPPRAATAPAAKATANPFRDRLNEIRKQTGNGAQSETTATAQMEDPAGAPAKKGCLARMVKGSAAAALLMAACYCLLKYAGLSSLL